MTRDVDVTGAPVEAMVARVSSPPVDAGPAEPGEPDVILGTRDAVALLGGKPMTEERLRTLASDGRVPAEMVSHKWLFSRDELLRIKRECPEVLYARRTPAVIEVTRARREKSRATMLRLNATQDRHEAARRGYLGLLAKIAREIDPQNILPAEERERRVMMRYRAQMADARARRQASRKPMTREEKFAEIEARARKQAEQERDHADDGQKPLAICFQCWREDIGGRPPAKLVNALCDRHQKENDEFAASLRGEAS